MMNKAPIRGWHLFISRVIYSTLLDQNHRHGSILASLSSLLHSFPHSLFISLRILCICSIRTYLPIPLKLTLIFWSEEAVAKREPKESNWMSRIRSKKKNIWVNFFLNNRQKKLHTHTTPENHTAILDDEFVIQSRNKIRYSKTSLIKLESSSGIESTAKYSLFSALF